MSANTIRIDHNVLVKDIKNSKQAITLLSKSMSFEIEGVGINFRPAMEKKLLEGVEGATPYGKITVLYKVADECNVNIDDGDSEECDKIRELHKENEILRQKIAANYEKIVPLMVNKLVTYATTPAPTTVADVVSSTPSQPPVANYRPKSGKLSKSSLTNPLLVLSRFIELQENIIYPFGKEESMYSDDFYGSIGEEVPCFWVKDKYLCTNEKTKKKTKVIGWRMVKESPIVHVYMNRSFMQCFLAYSNDKDLDKCDTISLRDAVSLYLCDEKRGHFYIHKDILNTDIVQNWLDISLDFDTVHGSKSDGSEFLHVLPAVQETAFSLMTKQ
jgi:hypothetical protein